MAIDELSVVLSLDADEFYSGLNRAERKTKDLGITIDQVSVSIQNNRRVMRQWANSISQSLTGLDSALNLIERFGGSLSAIGSSFIAANSSIEKTQILLSGLETGSDSVNSVADSMEYLRETARNTPFELNELSQSFTRMKLAGLDPAAGSLDALVNGISAFGGGTLELERASVALQQMMGKSVVSMEEMRQQLGEAMPDAMRLMADGLGMTIQDLSKLIETGTLESGSAIEAMLTQMQLQNAGASAAMMDTWEGLTSQIRSELQLLATEIGDAGLWDEMKESLRETLELVRGDDFRDFAYSAAQAVQSLIEAFNVLLKNIDLVLVAAKALGAYFTGQLAGAAVSAMAAMIGEVGALYASFVALNRTASKTASSIDSLGDSAKKAGFNMVVLTEGTTAASFALAGTNGSGGFSSAMKGFGANTFEASKSASRFGINIKAIKTILGGAIGLLSRFGGPIALVGYSLYELSDAFDLMGKRAEEATEKARKGIISVTPEMIKATSDEVKELANQMTALRDANSSISKGGASRFLPETGMSASYGAGASLSQEEVVQGQYNALEKEHTEGTDKLNDLLRQAGKKIISVMEQNIRDQTNATILERSKGLRSELNAMRVKYREEIKQAGDGSDELKKELSAKILERSLAQIDENEKAQIRIVNAQKKEAIKNINAIDEFQSEEKEKLIEGIKGRATDAVNAIIVGAEDQRDKLKRGAGIIEEGTDAVEKVYNNSGSKIAGQIAKNTALISGKSAEMAGIIGQVAAAQAKNSTYTEAEVSKLAEKATKLAEIIALQKELTSVTDSAASSSEKLNQKIYDSALAEANPYFSLLGSLYKYQGEINEVIATQAKLSSSLSEVGLSADQTSEAVKNMTDQMVKQSIIDANTSTAAIRGQIDAINRQILTTEELAAIEAEAFQKRVTQIKAAADAQRQYATTVKDPALKQAILDNAALLDTLAEKTKKLADQTADATGKAKGSFDAMMKQWSDMAENMEQVWTNATDSFADALTDFVMTGKLDLNSLADEILRGTVNVAIKGLISSLSGMAGGYFGFADGGVMTKNGAASLKSYANGGVVPANKPHVAVFGEGSQNEAFVPLPDGRSIPVSMNQDSQKAPNVSVNVINQSGQDVEAEQQGQARFDGEKYILDVVMKAMNRPGNFRTAMKGTTRQ